MRLDFGAARDEVASQNGVLVTASAEPCRRHREHAQALPDDLLLRYAE